MLLARGQAALPPIPRPGKILAMVQNYRKHAAEFGNEAPPAPVWFGKISSSLTGHLTDIRIPEIGRAHV